jgi:vacuolar-type H+-ATPase subunit I/STV1
MNASTDEKLRFMEEQNQYLLQRNQQLEAEVNAIRMGRPFPPSAAGPPTAYSFYGLQTDIHKANEIIRKLQEEVKTLRTRSRTAEASVRHLEKQSKERESTYGTLSTEVGQLKALLQEKTQQLDDATAQLSKCKKDVEELEKAKAANEKVIAWQIRVLNERHSSASGTGGGASGGGDYPNIEQWLPKNNQQAAPLSTSSTASSSPI